MTKKFNGIVSENLLLMFFSLMILPFLILFFFDHPSAVDWGLSQNTKIVGFLNTQIFYYYNWTGKYFSNIVLSYNPLYFNSIPGYKLLNLALMTAFIFILYILISEITSERLSVKEKSLITLSIIFLYLYAMPNLPQSFYWLTASVVYQFGILMIMSFLILYIRIFVKKDSRFGILYTVISVLLLIAIAGCSEMSMVTGILLIGLLFTYNLFKEKKINIRLLIFAIISAAASYVLISAPGNKVRGSNYPNAHQIIFSLQKTLSSLFDYLQDWIIYSPLLFVTILTIPVLIKLSKNSGKMPFKFSINPLYAFIIYSLFLYILFFTPVWSLGSAPFSRTVNIIYFVFLAGWFYNIAVLIFYLSEKRGIDLSRIPGYVYTLALIIVLVFLIKKNNVKLVYSDLLRGAAVSYNKELNERYDYILTNPSDSVVVNNLKSTPRSIYFTDIFDDPSIDVNIMYAHYFNKKSVSVIKPDSLQYQK